jgi:hypothetical protein
MWGRVMTKRSLAKGQKKEDTGWTNNPRHMVKKPSFSPSVRKHIRVQKGLIRTTGTAAEQAKRIADLYAKFLPAGTTYAR